MSSIDMNPSGFPDSPVFITIHSKYLDNGLIVYDIIYFVTDKTDNWMLLRIRGSSDLILRTATLNGLSSKKKKKKMFFSIILLPNDIIAKRLDDSDSDI